MSEDSQKPLIWWTSQTDCEALGEVLDVAPEYIVDQYTDRLGRNGRGRLWVDPQFGEVAVEPWPEDRGRFFELYCAGIVIRREDLGFVREFPGRVTDFELKPISAEV